MSDKIGDILSRSQFEEPPEVRFIKEFVRNNYQQTPEVVVRPTQIIIQVKSAALAGALRVRLYELSKLCGTSKRLVIRIS